MKFTHQHLRRAVAAGTLLAATATLSACGGDDSSSTSSSSVSDGEFNDADVTFASQMVVDHASAVHMARMVDNKEVSPEVAQRADEVEAAQTPAIEQMSTWLEAWGETVPDVGDLLMDMSDMDMSDMDTSDMDMGDISEDEMSALRVAEGVEFETLWLEMMVERHQGAVEMAQTEQNDGQYEPAIDLAEQIETSQTAEVEQMQTMLDN